MGTIAEYYDLETNKLVADGQRVALFTGHPGTLGAYREARLRQYLRDHVAARFGIASGFISDRDFHSGNISDRSSKQIDCLIYDRANLPNLIETESFVCVEPECAAAFVEIKSSLGINRRYAPGEGSVSDEYPFSHEGHGFRWTGTLVDALSNMASAISIMSAAGIERDSYFAGIISYSGNELQLLDGAITSGELLSQLNISTLNYLPDCICVLTSGWWSFEAYAWYPKEESEDGVPWVDPSEYNPQESVIVKITGSDLGGAPLQLFTAYLSGRLDLRAVGDQTRIGGLRSGKGRDFRVVNTRFRLASPGRGGS